MILCSDPITDKKQQLLFKTDVHQIVHNSSHKTQLDSFTERKEANRNVRLLTVATYKHVFACVDPLI